MAIGSSRRSPWITKPPMGVPVDLTNTLARGLVGYWAMQEGQGTQVQDIIGNNNALFKSGPLWIPGKFSGPAISLNGSSDYLQATTNSRFKPTAAITYCGWFYIKSIASSLRLIDCEDVGGTVGFLLSQGVVSGLLCRIGGTVSALSAGTIIANTWTHIGATYDGANMRLYINGAVVDTTAKTGAINYSGSSDLFIGRTAGSSSNFHNGLVDDVRVYNRALTTAEMVQLTQAPMQSYLRRVEKYTFTQVTPVVEITSQDVVITNTTTNLYQQLTFTPSLVQSSAPLSDTWYPILPDQLFHTKNTNYLLESSPFFYNAPPPATTINNWKPQYPDILYRSKNTNYLLESLTFNSYTPNSVSVASTLMMMGVGI